MPGPANRPGRYDRCEPVTPPTRAWRVIAWLVLKIKGRLLP